jgi:peptidoglycan/xylan/chitin deacetylase (PgdA/CDA1 family)
MCFLKRSKFHIVSLDDIIQVAHSKIKIPTRSIAITFDDGYLDCMKYAIPILTEFGFPATFFIVSGFIGKLNGFNKSLGLPPERLLDRQDIIRLARQGFEIGSHSLTHTLLTSLGEAELIEEVRTSKIILEDILGERVKYFAYPKGEFNDIVIDCIKDTGYDCAFATDKGSKISPSNLCKLKRVGVGASDTLDRFARKIFKNCLL